MWGIKVLHGEKSKVPIKDNYYTLLTNISLGKILGDAPTFIRATIESIELEKIDEVTSEAPVVTHSILLAILTPNKLEHFSVVQHYSPLNTVTIEVDGPNDVYLAGNYLNLSDYDDDEEEEEEIGEDALGYDENQLTKTLMNAVINNKLDEKKKK